MPRTVGHTRPERRSRQGRLLCARRSPREYRPEARRADPRCARGWSRGAARPDRTRHARAFRWPHVIVAERLRPHVFRLPIEKIRAGYKSDIYFARTKLILERDKRHERVTMQVFQKHPDAVVVGTDQTLAILHVGAGHYRDRTRADALFDRYLSAERRLYSAWTLLPTHDRSAYEPVPSEDFELSRELASQWQNVGNALHVSSLYVGHPVTPYAPVMDIVGV